GGQRRLLLPYRARPRLEPPLRDCGERGGADDPDPRRAALRTLSRRRSRFIASVTIARTVSETFFFVFSHATCSGVSHTLTRSVLRSATRTSTPTGGLYATSGQPQDPGGRGRRHGAPAAGRASRRADAGRRRQRARWRRSAAQ